MDWLELSDRERLVAEQAVLTLRALDQAADAAPMGRGLAVLEAAIADKGLAHLRNMLSLAANQRDEAKKKGSASGDVPAVKIRNSKPANRAAF
jgi:hypothetical protein